MSEAIFEFFGLRESPFSVCSDLRFFILHRQARAAWDEIISGIQHRKGLLLLTGEVGTGKTALVRALLDWLRHRGFPTALVFHSRLDSADLLDLVLADFGVPRESPAKTDQVTAFHRWLVEANTAGLIPVLIIDEAQGLSPKVLEQIRLLMNLEGPNEKLLQVVLVGQPELEEKLCLPELCHVRQHVTVRCRTSPLTLDQTRSYIEERLRRGGARDPQLIFRPEAIDAVHRYARGVPRVVNILCEHALIASFAANSKPVLQSVITEIARKFQFFDAPDPLAVDAATLSRSRFPDFIAPSDSGLASATLSDATPSDFAFSQALQPPEPLHPVSARSLPSRRTSALVSPPSARTSSTPTRALAAAVHLPAIRRDLISQARALVLRAGAFVLRARRWLSEPLRKSSVPPLPRALLSHWSSSLKKDCVRITASIAQWLRAPANSHLSNRPHPPHSLRQAPGQSHLHASAPRPRVRAAGK